MALPAKTDDVIGLPNFAAGFPNTATAATLGRRLAGNGGADPISPILLPSGGMPASMSMTAAPCEYPPRTSLVDGHCCAMTATRLVASAGAGGGFEEVVRRGIVDRVRVDGLTPDERAERAGESLTGCSEAGRVVGTASEDDLDVGARCGGGRGGRGKNASVAAAQTAAEVIAAARANVMIRVTTPSSHIGVSCDELFARKPHDRPASRARTPRRPSPCDPPGVPAPARREPPPRRSPASA